MKDQPARSLKDEDTRDAITYQSWALGLDSVLLHWVSRLHPPPLCHLFVTRLLGELVRRLGMEITLDDIFTILDKLYNNVKALDALNQELCMGEKETVSGWEVCYQDTCKILAASFLECFPPDHVAELKCDHFKADFLNGSRLWWPIWKASANEKTYFQLSLRS